MRKPVYVFNAGELERHQNTLRFSTAEGRRYVPVQTTSEIHAFGEMDLRASVHREIAYV